MAEDDSKIKLCMHIIRRIITKLNESLASIKLTHLVLYISGCSHISCIICYITIMQWHAVVVTISRSSMNILAQLAHVFYGVVSLASDGIFRRGAGRVSRVG